MGNPQGLSYMRYASTWRPLRDYQGVGQRNLARSYEGLRYSPADRERDRKGPGWPRVNAYAQREKVMEDNSMASQQ